MTGDTAGPGLGVGGGGGVQPSQLLLGTISLQPQPNPA